jgi:hypothetical protein
MLVAAQQRFIQNKGLVALVITTLVANLVVAFLHGIVPGILVSITDAIAAIVLAIVAIIWGLVLAIGSIPSIVNAIRATAAEAQGTAQAAIPGLALPPRRSWPNRRESISFTPIRP